MSKDGARAPLENSKALFLDISTTLAELEQITSNMMIYWAGFRVDKGLDARPLDIGFRAMQERETILRRKLARLMAILQAAHHILDPAGTKGRDIVDMAELIAQERFP